MNALLRGILSFVISGSMLWGMRLHLISGLAVVAVGLGWLAYRVIKSRNALRWSMISLGIISCIVVLMGYSDNEVIQKGLTYVKRYLEGLGEWIYRYFTQHNTEVGLYQVVFCIGIVISVTLIIYSITQHSVGLVITGLLSWGITLTLIIGFDDPKKYHTILMIIVTLSHTFDRYRSQIGKYIIGHIRVGNYYKVLVGMIGIIIAISYIGTQKAPIQLGWVDDWIKKLQPNDIYKIKYHPYGGQIGGPITLNDIVLFEVESKGALYLKSETKEVYEQNRWYNEKTLQPRDRESIEFADTMYFQTQVIDEKLQGPKDYIDITFKNIESQLLITPLKTISMTLPSSVERIYQAEDIYMITKPQEDGFSYRVDLYTPDFKNEDWVKMLNKSNKVENQQIKEVYTELPPTISSRMYELAKELTEPHESTYKKVKAIETYLRSEYAYTLTPQQFPINSEFVDYFLFEAREGYCTYFATAMTLLSRCVGIPSRYVQGYVMPDKYGTYRKTYEITSQNAHAWVEIYFEGVGWVPFEPTPTYEVIMNIEDIENISDKAAYKVLQETNTQKNVIKGLVTVIVIMTGLAIFNCSKNKKRQNSPRVKIQREYLKFMAYLDKNHMGIEEYETDTRYVGRLGAMLHSEEDKKTLKRVVELYSLAVYSSMELTTKEYNELRGLLSILKKGLK